MTRETLGNVLESIRNGLSIKQDKSQSGLPISRIETISDGTVSDNRVGFAGIKNGQFDDWLLKPGDILFSHINSVAHLGKCAIYEGKPAKLIHGMNLLSLRSDPKRLYPRYLLHSLRTPLFRAQLEKFVNKAVNQASVSISNLSKLELLIPPLAEQKRLAAILDAAQASSEKRRQAIAKLDSLLQSIFVEMFGDPFTNPKGWPKALLGDVITSTTDGPHVSPIYVNSGVPFLSTRHIRSDGIVWDDLKFISPADAQIHWRKCKPEKGDLLYTKGGTTGIAKVIDFDREIAVWVHVAVLKLNQNRVIPIWLETMLNTPCCYQQSQRYTHGIANRDLGLTSAVFQIFPKRCLKGNAHRIALEKVII